MNNYYFSFGQTHKHPITEKPMTDYYVKVIANNFVRAREMFKANFSRTYSFQYTEKDFNFAMFPLGCYEIIIEKDLKDE